VVEASRQEIDDTYYGLTASVNLLQRKSFHDVTHWAVST
jgi:hypothetical protein